MSFDQVVEIAKKELETLQGWKEVSISQDIKIWNKQVFKQTDIECFKFEAVLDCTPEELLFVLWETEYRMKWNDKQFGFCKILEQVEKNVDIEHNGIHFPFSMLSMRDFVVKRKFVKVENGYDVFFKSVSDEYKKPTNDFVRGEIVIQCCKIRKNGDKTTLVYINQLNLNGWVPGWIISKAAYVMPSQIIGDFSRGVKYFRDNKIDTSKHNLF
eukprot:gene4495-7875_t